MKGLESVVMGSAVIVYSSFTLATCITCLIACIAHFIAFSTSYWLVSDGNSPFIRIGLHEACFDNCHHPYCPGGDPQVIYNGCYAWTFNDLIQNDERFREIKIWLMPDWFNAAKTVFIINLPLLVVCTVVLLVGTCWAFAARYTVASTKRKDLALIILLYISLVLLVVASLLNITGIAIFSSNGPRRDYMPMSYKNTFGFSFWLDLTVCILLGLSCLSVFIAAVAKTLHIQGPRDPRYSEDMMLGRA